MEPTRYHVRGLMVVAVTGSGGESKRAICACDDVADAERIAACLNACSAWNTDAIEQRGVVLSEQASN